MKILTFYNSFHEDQARIAPARWFDEVEAVAENLFMKTESIAVTTFI